MVNFVLNYYVTTMASVIRVTKEFSFEMAHALQNYDGPCRNVHGHSYRLFVTLTGSPLNEKGHPKNGMVIDFMDIRNIVGKEVLEVFDHSVTISGDYEKKKLETLKEAFENIRIVAYQPTCENLAADFAARIKKKLPDSVSLHSLKLYETATSYAEWHASDNE
jgi:6-pyruvoyltetrahydropterin/6-carboxytetrahydropterin synthase